MSIKGSLIIPVLAALALGVISCTQPNQTAHSAGAQYVSLGNGTKFDSKLEANGYPAIYRYVDCDTQTILYTTSNGGISSVDMGNTFKKFCGE